MAVTRSSSGFVASFAAGPLSVPTALNLLEMPKIVSRSAVSTSTEGAKHCHKILYVIDIRIVP